MRQSNGYIVLFTVALTVLCAGALAGVFEALKGEHKKQEALDTKKQILSAVIEIEGKKGAEVETLYTSSIESFVVNNKGEKIEVEGGAEKVNVLKEFKQKDVSAKKFPVFIFSDDQGTKSYILPVYGNGLWDAVWGFVALDADMNTIKGVSFGHKGETPGLGARITDKVVRARFIGKQIFDQNNAIQGVQFQKGEKIDYTGQPHKVDGLAGASMTTNGVNDMLDNYFGYYESYFNSVKAQAASTKEAEPAPSAINDVPMKADSSEVAVDSAVVKKLVEASPSKTSE